MSCHFKKIYIALNQLSNVSHFVGILKLCKKVKHDPKNSALCRQYSADTFQILKDKYYNTILISFVSLCRGKTYAHSFFGTQGPS